MRRIRLIQISNGVGSGNIGDELMAQEFWKLLPASVVLDVPVLPESARYRGVYPPPHRYLPETSPAPELLDVPGLLVGDTPVAEFEGLRYPLQTVGPAISRVTRRGLPVDAIAVGVDRLHSPEARQLFATHYAAIRSWTVRSEACREALLDLGVAPERIRVAADLAWLFTPGTETDDWAAGVWESLGVVPDRPLLVVNAVHHTDPTDQTSKRVLAEALDRLAKEHGYQVAFLANESRKGPHFDTAAAAGIRALMQESAVEVPAEYYTPQEMVSLLRPAATVLTQRYHMAIQAILAGTIPVCLARGQKVSGLAREFDLLTAETEVGAIVERVRESAARRPERIAALAIRRAEHRGRAGEALSFLREYLQQGAAAPPRRAAVKQVAVIHLGGLGDLVLASSLVAALRSRYGKAKIHLLCRAPFARVAELFPSAPDEVLAVNLDPNAHREPGPALRAALGELDSQISQLQPDIVVSAELEPTWLSWYAASRWQAPVNAACTRLQAPLGLLPLMLREAGLAPMEFGGPAWNAEMVEGDRYAALARALGAAECPAPRWRTNPEQERETGAFLETHGIRGSYAVCFPLGAASTLVKRWPPSSFAAALEVATEHFAMPVLLTGEAHEREALEAQAAALRSRGATVAVLAGTAGELGLLAGLLARASIFLGNDTGPAHIAQAYGTPGAIVFGGGTWPHYRPWGPGAVGVVHPLPCFGCRWDCVFGQPVCIEGVTIEAVVRALTQAKANPAGAPEVLTIQSAVADSVIQLAGEWRTAARERLVKLEELSRVHEAVSAAAASRATAMDDLDRRLQGAETNWEEVQAAAEHRLELIGAISVELAELRGANSDRLQALENADRLLRRQDEEIQELRAGYAVRLIAIEEANQLLQKQQAEIGELREGYAARLVAIEEANALLRKQEAEIAELREGHAARLVAIEEANALLRKHHREIAELREGYAARLVAIEEANALLRKQETEIAELREGHAARLVAIEEANALLRKQEAEIAELREGHAARLVAIEEANALLRKQQQEIAELREGYAARLVAIESANALLRKQATEIAELREGHAARLIAIEEANALLRKQQQEIAELREGHAARLVAIEEANALLRKQQQEIAELREGHAARLVAIEEANALLRKQQQEIAELREGHAARLVAIEEANALLHAQQSELASLRGAVASLDSENARRAARIEELEVAASERLTALEHANRLLAAAHTAYGEQAERLRVFEQAAAERLAGLEATAAALRGETARRAQLAADLETLAAAQAEAREKQAAEREGWQTTVANLRAELNRERLARMAAVEELALQRAELDRLTAERDRYRRSTEELALSEASLRQQILAAESETLLQSVFRRATGKSD